VDGQSAELVTGTHEAPPETKRFVDIDRLSQRTSARRVVPLPAADEPEPGKRIGALTRGLRRPCERQLQPAASLLATVAVVPVSGQNPGEAKQSGWIRAAGEPGQRPT